MAKYRFRIDGGRYGGELAVGSVTDDFVRYWAPIIEEDGTYETRDNGNHNFETDVLVDA